MRLQEDKQEIDTRGRFKLEIIYFYTLQFEVIPLPILKTIPGRQT